MTQPESPRQEVFDDSQIDELRLRVMQGDGEAAHQLIERTRPIIEVTAVSAFEYGFDEGLHQREFMQGISESTATQVKEWRSNLTKRMDELTGEEHDARWYADQLRFEYPLVPGIEAVFGIAAAMESRLIDPTDPEYLRQTEGYHRAKFEANRNYEPSESVQDLLDRTGDFDVSVAKIVNGFLDSQRVVQGVIDGDPVLDPETAAYLDVIRNSGLDEQTISRVGISQGSFMRPVYRGPSPEV